MLQARKLTKLFLLQASHPLTISSSQAIWKNQVLVSSRNYRGSTGSKSRLWPNTISYIDMYIKAYTLILKLKRSTAKIFHWHGGTPFQEAFEQSGFCQFFVHKTNSSKQGFQHFIVIFPWANPEIPGNISVTQNSLNLKPWAPNN